MNTTNNGDTKSILIITKISITTHQLTSHEKNIYIFPIIPITEIYSSLGRRAFFAA